MPKTHQRWTAKKKNNVRLGTKGTENKKKKKKKQHNIETENAFGQSYIFNMCATELHCAMCLWNWNEAND